MREGRRETRAVPAPTEVAPLVAEVDALIAANRATVERARAHLGNLAHALKTPLAVLRNALAAPVPDLPAARAEAEALERLVQHHLARARVAARLAASPATSPLAVAGEVAAALRRLFAARGIVVTVTGDAAATVRMDLQDLTELLGNLMENACKWARHTVAVDILRRGAEVVLHVADDGPGLADDAARSAALQRGVRLDEAQPGTGLGLSIAADLALLHGGRLELGRAAAGGLLATLHLPARGTEG
jgi:signal transduction histidine kinase